MNMRLPPLSADLAHVERQMIIRSTHPEPVEQQQLRAQLQYEQARTNKYEMAMRGALRCLQRHEPVHAQILLAGALTN